jgi:hypothetical protein
MKKRLIALLTAALLIEGSACYAQQNQPTRVTPSAVPVPSAAPTFTASSVPAETRDRTLQILRGFKLIGPNEDLSVLENKPLDLAGGPPIRNLSDPFCEAGCDVAAAAAVGACAGQSGPPAAACIAAVEAGRQYCKSKC